MEEKKSRRNHCRAGLRRRSDRVEAQRVTVISKFDECRSARTRLLADETAAKMERDKADLDINRLEEERQRKHEDDARKLDKAKRKVMHEIEQLRQAKYEFVPFYEENAIVRRLRKITICFFFTRRQFRNGHWQTPSARRCRCRCRWFGKSRSVVPR